MATYFKNDFSDWSTGFTNRYNNSTQWSASGTDLLYPSGKASDWQAWTWDTVEDSNHLNIEFLAKLTTPSNIGASTHPFVFRGSGADESPTHYALYIYGGANRIRLIYCAGADTQTEIASATPITINTSTAYWLRVRFNGSGTVTCQAKIWADGDSEPGSWHIDTTTTNGPASSAGWNGVSTFANNTIPNAYTLHQLGAGTNGDTAPASAGSTATSIAFRPRFPRAILNF